MPSPILTFTKHVALLNYPGNYKILRVEFINKSACNFYKNKLTQSKEID